MSFTELKAQAIQLPPAEQRQLIACIIAVQTDSDQSFKNKLADKIDDRNPKNWVELDDLKTRISD